MAIDAMAPLRNLDGSVVLFEAGDVGTEPVPLTVRKILIDTLMAAHEDDARMSGHDKVRLVKLALRVDAEDRIDLPLDDIAFLVARVDKMCRPLVVYRIREILDPASI